MKAMPLTAVRGIRLAGAPSRIRTARECLEELGVSGYMLESLYKITYDRPHTFHLDAGNGATHKSDSYIASVHGGLKIFFMLIAGRYLLPGIFLDGDEVTETPRFQKTKFLVRPDTERLVSLMRKVR